MLAQAEKFCRDMADPDCRPRWISFLGRSGTGKTFLADLIYQIAALDRRLVKHRNLCCGVIASTWKSLYKKLLDRQYWLMEEYEMANFVFLDEIVCDHDPSGFAKDKLSELICSRVNKWTLITSNLDLAAIEKLDARISSRLIRDGNVIVTCNTKDFASR